ncbi:MAG: hypothetical protein WC730_01700 [Patescibacteria group bacterium]
MAGASTNAAAAQLFTSQRAAQQARTQRSFDIQPQKRIPTMRIPEGMAANRSIVSDRVERTSSTVLPFPQDRAEQFARTRHTAALQHQIATQHYALPEVERMIENAEGNTAEAMQETFDDYQDDMREIASANNNNAFQQMGGSLARQAQQQVTDKVIKEVTEKVVKQGGKFVRDMIWRVFGRGSVVDTPGETGWTWLSVGVLTTWYQSAKTLLFNGKDFLPGMLNFLEPSALPLKKSDNLLQQGMGIFIDIPWAIVGWFILLIIFGIIQVFLVMVGLILLGYSSILGPLADWLPSWGIDLIVSTVL